MGRGGSKCCDNVLSEYISGDLKRPHTSEIKGLSPADDGKPYAHGYLPVSSSESLASLMIHGSEGTVRPLQ
jgi:hypothetical protein